MSDLARWALLSCSLDPLWRGRMERVSEPRSATNLRCLWPQNAGREESNNADCLSTLVSLTVSYIAPTTLASTDDLWHQDEPLANQARLAWRRLSNVAGGSGRAPSRRNFGLARLSGSIAADIGVLVRLASSLSAI